MLREFFKEFGTLFLGLLGILVTVILGVFSYRSSKAQRAIERDKLKLQVLPKQREIYEAARQLIEHALSTRDFQKLDISKIREMNVKIDEARFYFSADTREFLSTITKTCEAFFQHLGERHTMNIDDDEKRRSTAEILTADTVRLRELYAALPEKLEQDLSLSQLTNKSRS
jgi:hypothetical protein